MEQEQERRRPGPRPKQTRFVLTSLKLPPDLKEQMDTAADAHGISSAELIRLAVTEWLEKHGRHYGT